MAAAFVAELKKLLGTDKLIIGTERTIKLLKTGKLAKVFVSYNVAKQVKEDIEYYSGLSKTEIVETGKSNEELGVICKKPFTISVLGVAK